MDEKSNIIKNLENEIKTYENDLGNVQKQLHFFKDNKSNVEKILKELNKKDEPLKK